MDDLIKRLRATKLQSMELHQEAADAIDGLADEVAMVRGYLDSGLKREEKLWEQLNAITSLLPDSYSESKDWQFDKSPVARIEWFKARIESLKQERDLADAQLDALRNQEPVAKWHSGWWELFTSVPDGTLLYTQAKPADDES